MEQKQRRGRPKEIVQEEINRIYDRDENGNKVKNQLD